MGDEYCCSFLYAFKQNSSTISSAYEPNNKTYFALDLNFAQTITNITPNKYTQPLSSLKAFSPFSVNWS
jgi:hypothetical protein